MMALSSPASLSLAPGATQSPGKSRSWFQVGVLLSRRTGPMLLVHVGALASIFTGASLWDWLVFAGMIPFRGFFITVAFHRYFSHRSFKTSRLFQFVMAFFGAGNIQNGALWWAAHHRQHHLHSDDPADPHSPVQKGFWWSHMGWLFATLDEPNLIKVRDLSRYPELVWLERFWLIPGLFMAGVCYLAGGWSMVCVGYCLSAVVTYHLTFAVNSLGHIIGSRRYDTPDASRNSFLMALLTMGDGWHNNHHYYAKSARHGFAWWEIDGSYYLLLLLQRLGIVWGLQVPPPHILQRSSAPARERPAPILVSPSAVDPSPRDLASCAASPARSI